MVGNAGNGASARAIIARAMVALRKQFTVGQPDHLPYRYWLRGWESHPPEEVYEASLCALVEFPAVEIGGIGV